MVALETPEAALHLPPEMAGQTPPRVLSEGAFLKDLPHPHSRRVYPEA